MKKQFNVEYQDYEFCKNVGKMVFKTLSCTIQIRRNIVNKSVIAEFLNRDPLISVSSADIISFTRVEYST